MEHSESAQPSHADNSLVPTKILAHRLKGLSHRPRWLQGIHFPLSRLLLLWKLPPTGKYSCKQVRHWQEAVSLFSKNQVMYFFYTWIFMKSFGSFFRRAPTSCNAAFWSMAFWQQWLTVSPRWGSPGLRLGSSLRLFLCLREDCPVSSNTWVVVCACGREWCLPCDKLVTCLGFPACCLVTAGIWVCKHVDLVRFLKTFSISRRLLLK